MPRTFEAWLKRRSLRVQERIQRLNPIRRQGEILRGWHPSTCRAPGILFGAMRFQEVVRRYGREAWDHMPATEFIKNGRRKAIRWEALQDGLWKRHMVENNHSVSNQGAA